MVETGKEGVNFILAPTMTPQEVVSLLLSRFPAMRDLICPDEDCFEQPTCVYDSFAHEVVKRVNDRDFFESAIRFINDIAESKDPLLSTVLIISLLEGIAEDPDVARRVSGSVSENARRLLRDVEVKVYHRMNG